MTNIKTFFSLKYRKVLAMVLSVALLLTTLSVASVPVAVGAADGDAIGATGTAATQNWGAYTNSATIATGPNTAFNSNWEGATQYNNQSDFYIRTAEDFNEFWYQATNGGKTYAGKTVHIANNITLTGSQNSQNYKTWTSFQGTLDGDLGNGEMAIISGMNRRTGDATQGGMFTASLNATIKNIVFKECDVFGWKGVSLLAQDAKDTTFENIQMWNCRVQNDDGNSYDFVGGFSAYAAGSTYRNCSYTGDNIKETAKGASSSFVYCGGRVTKDWKGSENGWYGIAGAFVGQAEKSSSGNPITIENCYVNSNIQSRLGDVGGFVGYALDDCQGVNITNSTMNGYAMATNYTRGSIECYGGLIGRTLCSATITSSVNNATVKGKKSVGGIVGYSGNSLTIKSTANNGNVLSNNEYAGGFSGLNNNTGTKLYDTCYNKGQVYSDSIGTSVGGIIGASQNATIQNSYNIGEIKGTSYFGGIYGSMQNGTSVNISNCLSTGNITRVSGSSYNYGGIAGEYKGGAFTNNYYANAGSNVAVGGKNDSEAGSQKLTKDFTLGLGRYDAPMNLDRTFMNNLGITGMSLVSVSSANTAVVGIKDDYIRGLQTGNSSLTGTLVIKGKNLSSNGFTGAEDTLSTVPYSVTVTVDSGTTSGAQDWIVTSQSKATGIPGQEYQVKLTVKTANDDDVPTSTPIVTVIGDNNFSETVSVTGNGNTFTGKIILEEGNYTFTYSYPGTIDNAEIKNVTVEKIATASNISISPSTAVVGEEMTITATVEGVEGDIDFKNYATMTINGTEHEIGNDGVVKFTPQTTGENNIEFNFEGNAGYFESSATGSFLVGKETPTMSFSNQPDTTYDGEAYSKAVLDADVGHNFTVVPSNVVYTYYVDSNCQTKTTAENSGSALDGGAPAFAGDYWLQSISAENEYYNQVSATKSFKINKAKITAEVTTDGKIYDGADTATGKINVFGSVITDNVVLVVNDFKFESADAGNRTATGIIEFANGQEANIRNYKIDQDNSTILNATISQKGVTVSVTVKDKYYDGTKTAELDSAIVTGLLEADKNDVTANVSNLTFADANAGENKAVTVGKSGLDGAKSANYMISATLIAENAKIMPIPLTITINPITILTGQYGSGFNFDTLQSEISVSGFVNGETIDSLASQYKAPVLTVDSSINGINAFEQKSVEATISVTDNGNYTFPATVSFLLTCQGVEAVEGVDYKIETADGSPFTADGWTSQKVTVTALGGASKFNAVSKTADVLAGTPSIVFDATTLEEDIKFYLVNSDDGTMSRKVSGTFGVDMDAPEEISLSVVDGSVFKKLVDSVTFGLFFDDHLTFEVNSEDFHSGVASYTVTGTNSVVGGEDVNEALTPGDTFKISKQFVGSLTIEVTDNVGNTRTEEFESFAIDKIAPTAPNRVGLDSDYEADKWTKEDVIVTAGEAAADSGIKEYRYSIDNGATWISMTHGVQTTPSTATSPANVTSASVTIGNNGVTEILFRAVSNSGIAGANSLSTTVKIDKVAPVVNVQSDYIFGTWTNNDVEITVANTASNVSDVTFKYSTDGTNWSDMVDGKLTVSTDTNATYKFKAISGAGIETVSDDCVVKVQKTAPSTVNYAISPEIPDGANHWYKTNPTLSISGNANSQTSAPIAYVSHKLYTGSTAPDAFTKVDGTTATPVVLADGVYTLVYFATDEAGNNSPETTKTFSVDTTAPIAEIAVKTSSFKEMISTVTFGIFLKNSAEITIKSEDALSDVASVDYQKVAKGGSFDFDGTWSAYSAPFKVDANEEFAIYAKVTDKAGHISIVNSDGIVVYTDSVLKNTQARFCPDKDEKREGYEDVVVEMNLNGNTLNAITFEGKHLVVGTDYIVSENSVTLLKEYLAKVVDSHVEFEFSFNPMGETYVDGEINEAPAIGKFKVVKVTHVGIPEITSTFDEKAVYNKGEKANELKVEAKTSNGQLTYQWFVNGEAIEGATASGYVPTTETNGIFEYYVQVTSTDNTANGDQVSVVNSDVATIVVKNSQVTLPELSEDAPAITLVTDTEQPETTKPEEPNTDKPEEITKANETTSKPSGTKSPSTGDNSSNAPYYFAAVSGVVLLAIVIEEIIRKKKSKH